MGLGAALSAVQGHWDETLDACFWGIVAVAVACQMLLTVGALLFLERRSTRSLALVLPVAGFSVLFAALRVVPESLLRRHLRLDRVSQSEGAAAAVGLLVAVGFALHESGVWALVYADLAAGATRAGLTAWFSGWRPRPRFEFKALHQLLRYGLARSDRG